MEDRKESHRGEAAGVDSRSQSGLDGGVQADETEAPNPIPFPVAVDIHSVALTGLFLLALLYTLHYARAFLIPIVLAIMLSHLLSPLVRRLKRAGIPETVSAGLVLIAFLGTLGLGLYQLSGPAKQWLLAAPQSLTKVRAKVATLLRPMQRVSETAERVAQATDLDGSQTLQVEIKEKSIAATMFGETQQLVGTGLAVSLLLFLLLSAGDLFLTKAIKALPRLADKKRAVQITRETEAQVTSYLVASTLVNTAFGVVIGFAMYLLGMPNPVLWGVLAGITNFIPFLGSFVCTIVLGAVALIHFDGVGRALLVPAVFQALNLLESSVVTPLLVGRQVSLNPVVIFTAVLFWGWIWGIPGALLAVPIMASVKIVCDHIVGLAAVGEFLGN